MNLREIELLIKSTVDPRGNKKTRYRRYEDTIRILYTICVAGEESQAARILANHLKL